MGASHSSSPQPKLAESAKLSMPDGSPNRSPGSTGKTAGDSPVMGGDDFVTPSSSPEMERPHRNSIDRFSRLETAINNLMPKTPNHNSSHSFVHNHLGTWQTTDPAAVLDETEANQYSSPMVERIGTFSRFAEPVERVFGNILIGPDGESRALSNTMLLRAHACKRIYHDPTKVKAAVVTCGGLCPGLNSIIRGISKCLLREYGVKGPIIGFTSGCMLRTHRPPPNPSRPERWL